MLYKEKITQAKNNVSNYLEEEEFLNTYNDDDDFYDQNLLEDLIESDEISGAEEGFMRGYLES